MIKRTLYVSDLDGTLLHSDETTSLLTNQTIDYLVEKGMLFSYATARSYTTARKVTKGLHAKIPLIVYNGAFIIDNITGEIMTSNTFTNDIDEVIKTLIHHDIYPIVYAFIDGNEKFSFIEEKCTSGMKAFIESRQGDPRTNPVHYTEDLYKGQKFYITCIDHEEKLKPFYHLYKEIYHVVFQKDIYTHAQWLEILPQNASKSKAIQQLKEQLHCERVIVFGDGKNDIDMFEIADEAYAVENAVKELKDISTQVIKSNDEDGVAKWLLENYQL